MINEPNTRSNNWRLVIRKEVIDTATMVNTVNVVIIPRTTIKTINNDFLLLVSLLNIEISVNGNIGNRQGDNPVARPANMKKKGRPIVSSISMPKKGITGMIITLNVKDGNQSTLA